MTTGHSADWHRIREATYEGAAASPMPTPDPSIAAHLEWLGFVRPTGLVVSAPALARHGATLNRHDAEGQQRLRSCVEERAINGDAAPQPRCRTSAPSRERCWTGASSLKAYAGTPEAPMPPELEVRVPDTGETLRPQFAVRKATAGQPANQQASSSNAAPANNGNGESLGNCWSPTPPHLAFRPQDHHSTIRYYAGSQIEAAS